MNSLFQNEEMSGEDFMHYCRKAIKDIIPITNANLLYFFNGMKTFSSSDALFPFISGKENVMLIFRTEKDLFCIHFKEQIPQSIPEKYVLPE